jgi:hypothetical protein
VELIAEWKAFDGSISHLTNSMGAWELTSKMIFMFSTSF